MNPRRERIIQFAAALFAATLAAFAARYGIVLPPLPPPVPVEPSKPAPMPPGPEQQGGKADAAAAIVRLSFKGVGCSATVIGPRRPDGRWWVLTAAHCSESPGQHGTIRFLDGRTAGVVVQSRDVKSDCCWMVTESNSETYPFALLAARSPAVGDPVWHASYGVDRPGNKERGQVSALPDDNGQVRFLLSVSSGDSGGGIVVDSAGDVVGAICCTSARGQKASVWACSPEAALRAQPTVMVLDDWVPIEVPLRMK